MERIDFKCHMAFPVLSHLDLELKSESYYVSVAINQLLNSPLNIKFIRSYLSTQ